MTRQKLDFFHAASVHCRVRRFARPGQQKGVAHDPEVPESRRARAFCPGTDRGRTRGAATTGRHHDHGTRDVHRLAGAFRARMPGRHRTKTLEPSPDQRLEPDRTPPPHPGGQRSMTQRASGRSHQDRIRGDFARLTALLEDTHELAARGQAARPTVASQHRRVRDLRRFLAAATHVVDRINRALSKCPSGPGR